MENPILVDSDNKGDNNPENNVETVQGNDEGSNNSGNGGHNVTKNNEKHKILGILAIVFGGIAILFCWLVVISVLFGLVALDLGIIAMVLNRKNKNALSVTGLILGILGFVISLVVTIVLLAVLLHHSPNKILNLNKAQSSLGAPSRSSNSDNSNNSSSSSNNTVGETTGQAFSWTYSSFMGLTLGDSLTGAGGENYTNVIKQFGQPITTTDDSSEGTATRDIQYRMQGDNNYSDGREVDLTFTQQSDKSYLLSSATENQLGSKNTDIAGTYCPFAMKDYDNLQVGDSQSGEGGQSYDDIVKKFGYPTSIGFSNFEGNLSCNATWASSDYETRVSLDFNMQSDGHYLLSQKQQNGLQSDSTASAGKV